ncbi:MAG TPA: plasmid stabilization protein [Lentisphaeria bacterium]|nr:plasmid stabilization protein [Lentisphaeria bacterium]
MRFSFHELAETELVSAIEYYESCQTGLGFSFSEEVYATIERVCQFPLAWESIDTRTRRCLTSRFPYGILYRISESEIRIMAIMNLHRKPGYWKNRK